MMKTWPVNVPFDGAKFAKRYGLNPLTDFSMNGNMLTVGPDAKVTDNPPVFEASDPPVDKFAALRAAIDNYKNPPATDARLVAFLTELKKVFT